jgi:hypothetical protein
VHPRCRDAQLRGDNHGAIRRAAISFRIQEAQPHVNHERRQAPVPLPVATIKKWNFPNWKTLKDALKPADTSVDQASFYMLNLYRSNLEVRLRTIDQKALSAEQQEIFTAVTGLLKEPASPHMTARNLEWDEIYKAESLIALLFAGPQLRQEIGNWLQDLAKDSPAEAESLRRDYEALLNPPADAASDEKMQDAMLRSFMLRVMESLY